MVAVLYSRSKAFQGGSVAPEFVLDDNSWLTKRPEQFAEEPICSLFIAPRLNEDVQHVAIAINSAPQPILLPVHWKDNFVQVPFIRHFGAVSADHPSIL